jgi:hypothetical protein
VAAYWRGLQVIDVRDPASPRIVGAVDTPGDALGVAVAEGFAYVADHRDGLQVIDVRDPASPQIVGAVDTPGSAAGVAVAEGFAYVADAYHGLQVIDVRDPAAPRIVGAVDTSGRAFGVAVADRFAYVVGHQFKWYSYYSHWFEVVDVWDPASPQLVDSIVTSGRADNVAFVDGFAYVAGGRIGLRVIDVNPPLENVHSASEQEMTATVPADFVRGPYHVRITQPEGEWAELYKGFRVCERLAIALELEPVSLPEPPQISVTPLSWRARLSGDAQIFDGKAKRETLLGLPELAEDVETTFTASPDPGLSAIELHLAPGQEQGLVKLIGADEDAIRDQWDAIVEAGGVPLPAIDDHAYGDVELMLQRKPANASPVADPQSGHVGLAPVVYRYEFTGGALTAARAWGQDVDHVFTAKATYDWTCEVENQVSYVDTLTALCEEFAAEHPELVLDCAF